MKMRILHFGEEPLRQSAEPVTVIDDDLRKLVNDMFETMKDACGIGLAAPQIGVAKRLFVVDLEKQPLVFVNPNILKKAGKENFAEGCLSFPGLHENVQRATLVIVTATDLDGNEFKITAEGLLARVIQHEYDHLDGVLLIDRISKARRFQLKKELVRIETGLSATEEDEEDPEEKTM